MRTASSEGRGRRRRGRRTWPQRLLLSLNILLIIAALSTAGGLGYAYEAVGDLPRISMDGVLDSVSDGGEAQPVNVLLVGTDSAANLEPGDQALEGRATSSQLADVIMVLRLEPESGDAALLSIPRDLWVPIAGTDHSEKINAAFAAGGAPALVQTIDDYLGIPLHHFVAVDFAGFKEIVAAIGGVEVYFEHPARDENSHLLVEEAGCQHLDADEALAYARSRFYESYIDGRWVPDNRSDFGRIRRQQEFMQLALSEAFDRGIRNPATLNALVDAVDDAVIIDDSLTPAMMLDIARAFRLFDPDSLGGYTLEEFVVNERKGGQLALVLNETAADPVLDLFRGTQGLAPTPESIRVHVRNGSGERDQAREVASDLRLADFVVPDTDNARETVERTVIRYTPGQRRSAEFLARYLAATPVLVEERDVTEPPLVLVTGADYAGLLAEPRPAGPPERSTSSTTEGTAPPTTSDTSVPGTGGGRPPVEEAPSC